MTTRSKSDWPRIRTRVQRGKTYWSIDCGMIDGKRVIYTRSSEKEAKPEAERLRRRHAKVGNDALRLNEDHLRDATRAIELSDGTRTLLECAEFMLLHGAGESGSITVRELYHQYFEDRIASHRAHKTMIDIRHRLGHFAEEHADVKANKITTRDLQTWLNQLGGGPTTKKNARTHFSGLFNFALNRQ